MGSDSDPISAVSLMVRGKITEYMQSLPGLRTAQLRFFSFTKWRLFLQNRLWMSKGPIFYITTLCHPCASPPCVCLFIFVYAINTTTSNQIDETNATLLSNTLLSNRWKQTSIPFNVFVQLKRLNDFFFTERNMTKLI